MPDSETDDAISPEAMDVLTQMMNETEEFYQEVLDAAQANMKSRDLKLMPKDEVRGYERDLATAERLYDKYCEAFDAARGGALTASRIARLQKSHDAFLTATEVVDEGNGMFAARIDSDLAAKCAGVVALFQAILKGQEQRMKSLADDLVALEKLLIKARKEVTGAEIQRDLNLAITAIGLCLPSMTLGKQVMVTIGTTVVRLSADAIWGPTGPDLAGAAKTLASEYAGVADAMGAVGGRLVSVTSMADTLNTDSKEVAKARKTLADVKKRLKSARSTHGALERALSDSAREAVRLTLALDKAANAAKDAGSRYQAHKARRHDLRAELDL